MVGTNTSTNENHNLQLNRAVHFYRSRRLRHKGCIPVWPFFYMVAPMKSQVENGLCKIFEFWGQTIDVSDQAMFTLKYSVFHDEEGKKIDVSNPIIVAQRRSSRFLSFIMMVHPDQADPKCNHSHITCRTCVQLLLYVDEITHRMLGHLTDLEYGRNPDIATLKKYRGDIFSEYFTDIFKEKFL